LANVVGLGKELCDCGPVDNLDIVRCLVCRGADAGLRNKDGKTVIEYAREAGSDELLAILLDTTEGEPRIGQDVQGVEHAILDEREEKPSGGVAENASEITEDNRAASGTGDSEYVQIDLR
jgi:hypothetical protein